MIIVWMISWYGMLSVELKALSHIDLVNFLASLASDSPLSPIWLSSLLFNSMRMLKKLTSIFEIWMHTWSFFSVEQSRSLSSLMRVDKLIIWSFISFNNSAPRSFCKHSKMYYLDHKYFFIILVDKVTSCICSSLDCVKSNRHLAFWFNLIKSKYIWPPRFHLFIDSLSLESGVKYSLSVLKFSKNMYIQRTLNLYWI